MTPTLVVDHIAVRVSSLSASVPWYTRFFAGRQTWALTEFSDLTRSRLPGISALTEIVAGEVKFHLFEQQIAASAGNAGYGDVQHVGIHVDSINELKALRDRWVELSRDPDIAASGSVTELTTDASTRTVSFYCTDPDGTEFEIVADGVLADLR